MTFFDRQLIYSHQELAPCSCLIFLKMKTRMVNVLWTMLLFLPLHAISQHTITGSVKSSEGQTLTGVKITLKDTYHGAYTDTKGEFSISNVSKGNYELIVTLLGFEKLIQTVSTENGDLRLDLTLFTSALMIEEVQITGVRADAKTPTTYTNLSEEQIGKSNYGQDLPYLLEGTPSTVVTSDAGAGVGYTGIRIRGVDPTRTNVTVNGIPMNDSESHGVWWVNMPDFASSSENIQVQRGVGTSSNGAAAFGSSINIKTDNIERKPYAVLDNSAGSFNTLRNTVKVGTGLINEKFAFDARLSRISSDGFIDRAQSNLKSFYLSGAYVGKKSILKANIFSGAERTYQAWWGVPEAKYKEDEDGLLTHFYNNYFPGGMYQTAADSANLFNSGSNTYNYYLYENEVDNYQQDHYQLHYTRTINSKLNFNVSGHYTRGRGYYEQYKLNQHFSTYGFEPVAIGGDTITQTDLIRRRWLDNHFYGAVFSLNYSNQKNLRLTLGGGANQYNGDHFGEVIWARMASQSELGARYYDNRAEKLDVNIYLKGNYEWQKFNFYGDLQVRHIDYSYLGFDESFGNIVPLQQEINFTFFNPKAGLSYQVNDQSELYTSYAVAHREPVRSDFIESTPNSRPKEERLDNIEAGYRLRKQKFYFNGNIYWMNYKDQLILTGKINDVGSYIRTNVEKSYRAGIELEGGYRILKNLSASGNVTYSQNKIARFIEYVDNYDNYDSDGNMIQDEIEHTNTSIAFSPDLIASIGILYEPIKNLEINLLGKHVGEQFLDNTGSKDRLLDAYTIFNLGLSYGIERWGFKEIRLGAQVNNLLNFRYANNGYTWGYIAGGERIIENFVYPQAGRNILVRLTLKM